MVKSFCRRAAAAAVAVCALGLFASVAPALADGGQSTVNADVLATAIPHETVFGPTAPNTPETVSFIFREANLSQLEAQAQAGFSHYLSVAQFAAEYGQPAANVKALVSYLCAYGIKATVYPNNIDVSATGTAGQFDKALSVTQDDYSTPAIQDATAGTTVPAQSFHGIASEPKLPTSIAQNLVAILGLTNYASASTNLEHSSSKLQAITSAGSAGGSSSQSACEQASGLPDDCNTPETFASHYGLDPLYQQGAAGQGTTLGIVTFASVDPGAPQYFWNNVLKINTSGRSVNFDQVDGGSGAPSFDAGSSETDLDVEQSGAVAPKANIVVYEAPNSDSGQIDALFTAATQNVADTVSQSWGESETYIQAAIATGAEATGYVLANDEAFLELDAQGQSSFVSSGDDGAYDATGDIGTTNLSVDSPGDSPYTTAAGGTTLPWSATLASTTTPAGPSAQVTVPFERDWGWDYLWPAIAKTTGVSLLAAAQEAIAGDGGGFSALEPQPSYQHGVSGTNDYAAVQWLTPTDYNTSNGILLPTEFTLNPNAPLTFGAAGGRALPDVVTNADPYTGYIEWSPSFVSQGYPELDPGWGGTSFVAPELNGSTAVIDSLLHRRVGFWNPQIYRFATSSSSPFFQIQQTGTDNDNLYYTSIPGHVFDAGSGLGIPNFAKLAADFAG